MTISELSAFQISERCSAGLLKGAGERRIANWVVDRTTARSYIVAAIEFGLGRNGGTSS